MNQRRSSTHGFKRTASLVAGRIRDVSAKKGFGESRVLTQWTEIVGPDIAAIARPVEISYGRDGLGGTLILLTKGAYAPMLEMQKEQIKERINAIYGYSAIKRVRITQTARSGFSEGQVDFSRTQKNGDQKPRPPLPAATNLSAPVKDDTLRLALERLGTHILSNQTKT